MLHTVFDFIRGETGGAGHRGRASSDDVTATGKSARKLKKKANKKAKQRCQAQVAQCQAGVALLCGDDAECLEGALCCDIFGTCNTAGALACLFPPV